MSEENANASHMPTNKVLIGLWPNYTQINDAFRARKIEVLSERYSIGKIRPEIDKTRESSLPKYQSHFNVFLLAFMELPDILHELDWFLWRDLVLIDSGLLPKDSAEADQWLDQEYGQPLGRSRMAASKEFKTWSKYYRETSYQLFTRNVALLYCVIENTTLVKWIEKKKYPKDWFRLRKQLKWQKDYKSVLELDKLYFEETSWWSNINADRCRFSHNYSGDLAFIGNAKETFEYLCQMHQAANCAVFHTGRLCADILVGKVEVISA